MTQTWVDAFTVPYKALGIAWDGSGFWIGEYTGFFGGERIMRFDASGNPTGESFRPATNVYIGGLAFDTTDSTLFIGTFGGVYHCTLTGTELGFLPIPAGEAPGRFVDTLEFEGGAVPRPADVRERLRLERTRHPCSIAEPALTPDLDCPEGDTTWKDSINANCTQS